MPVQIGAKAHSFSDPTALLSDCHRRIEGFLGSLERVAPLLDRPLEDDARSALAAALGYFRDAAPKHTADEEESLFPRLRHIPDPELESAIATLFALEKDHGCAESLHAEVNDLGRRCLDGGKLQDFEAQRFQAAVAELASLYKEHIRIEDAEIFPVAARTLPECDRAAIAPEMAARRKIS